MFTGLIEDIGRVISIRKASGGGVLQIESSISGLDLSIGESIAVNGICLTLAKKTGKNLFFDVLAETLSKTNLDNCKKEKSVNIERALQVGGRLGGHFLQGHVDGLGKVISNGSINGEWQIEIGLQETGCLKYLIQKGSIGIDGVSLTIAKIDNSCFTVCVIPETLRSTNLADRKRGDYVNLEFDMIGKYVLSQLEGFKDKKTVLSMKYLEEKGFLS
ncbi:MAG: riboflavin synthase [Candidatus Theseobacter exili]|nr:riboflavin synthase [Candidatus Theseobacter exili]